MSLEARQRCCSTDVFSFSPSLAPTSPVLHLTLEDIRGRVFAMSRDQNGCRMLQEQLGLVVRGSCLVRLDVSGH